MICDSLWFSDMKGGKSWEITWKPSWISPASLTNFAAEKTDMLIPITGAAAVHQAPPHNKASVMKTGIQHTTHRLEIQRRKTVKSEIKDRSRKGIGHDLYWMDSKSGVGPMKIELEKVGGSAAEVMCHCVTVNTMASTELQEAQARK